MKNWYTRQEVADILGVSKTTVYHYAKQGKITKIDDPHNAIREVRYEKEAVDTLAETRKRNQPTGLRPAQLAKELGIPLPRVYSIIKGNKLPVDEIPLGEEMTGYSISEELAEWIRHEAKRVMPSRGTRVEFYNSQHDISLYQLFLSTSGQPQRVFRNEEQEWGFYLPSQAWISYLEGLNMYNFKAAYKIHRKNMPMNGYTDFLLPKNREDSFYFLDFVYKVWGIENIRLREHDTSLALSIKSGRKHIPFSLPEPLKLNLIESFIVSGALYIEEEHWNMISGTKRTTIEIPKSMFESVQEYCDHNGLTFSEYVESSIKDKLEKD